MGQMEEEWSKLVAWEQKLAAASQDPHQRETEELRAYREELARYRAALATFLGKYEEELRARDENR